MFTSFNLRDVKLADCDAQRRRQLVHQYIINFDLERLLYSFKVNAGIPCTAIPLGGWEAPDCGLRGHFVGHYLSACSKLAYAENNQELCTKANKIIDVFEECILPNGFLSAFKEEVLDTLEREENRDVWAPYYTLHKILQGLIDCYSYINNSRALNLALRLAQYIKQRFQKLSYWKIDGILRCTKLNPANEFGGLGKSLYSLYEITNDQSIFEFAKLFDRDYILEPLSFGKDVLDNLHANTHLPIIASAMHRFDLTGEEKYKSAAINFYELLLGRSFANGNNSSKATHFELGAVSEKSEHFGRYGCLEDALTGSESESCCAHNTEKIVEHLFKWSSAVEYLEHLESLKYNATLNSTSYITGLSQYHQPLGTNVVKKFSEPYDSFWCCTGTGIEAMSELNKNIWFKNDESIILNCFIASEVSWHEKGVKIVQQTQFPDVSYSSLTIMTEKTTRFTLQLKEKSIKSIKVNNIPIPLETKRERGFLIIERVFHNQDCIEIEIAASLHLEPLQGSNNRYAIKYGNILLAQLGESTQIDLLTNENINDMLLRNHTEQLEFIPKTDQNVKFIPLYRIENENYSVYLENSIN